MLTAEAARAERRALALAAAERRMNANTSNTSAPLPAGQATHGGSSSSGSSSSGSTVQNGAAQHSGLKRAAQPSLLTGERKKAKQTGAGCAGYAGSGGGDRLEAMTNPPAAAAATVSANTAPPEVILVSDSSSAED